MRRSCFLGLLVLMGVSGTAWGSAGAAQIRLAYATTSPVPGGIFRIDPGKKPARVSKTASPDEFPAWSSDGKSLAYVHQIKAFKPLNGCRIVVVSGGQGRPIPGVTTDCYASISWGRNGLIAFNDQKSAVWVVKPDGSGLHKVMNSHEGLGAGSASRNPAWSPDDKNLAFGNGVSDGTYV